MKKIKFIAMAMLALLTAQCKKNEPEPEPKVMVPISGSVSFGGGSKTEITTTGYVTPISGDMIYIYNNEGTCVGSLECTDPAGQAFTCSGTIDVNYLGKTCTFMYLGSGSTDDEDVSIVGTSSTISFADQTGISANSGKISGIDKFHVGSCKANVSEGGKVELPMRTKISIAYFQLKDQNGSAMANNNITISGVSATATINKIDGTISGDGTGTIRVHTDANGCFYMALVPQSDAPTFTFTSANANGTGVFPYGIGECCFYSEQGNVSKPLPVQMNSIVTPDLLTGKFSVSATEYAQFSRGNLYCTDNGTSASPRYTFNFERNQYDFRHRPGKGSMLNGVFSTSSGTPANTSGSFQWNVSAAVPGQDYGAFGTTFPGTPADDAMIDWGQAIGGNWYTMTKEEMSYLIGYGTFQRPNYENLRKVSKIDFSGFSVNGFVLAPDNYDFTSHPLRSSYSESEWGQAEQDYGLVFLPCAGFNYDAWAVGVTGRYYASNHPGHHLYFGENGENYIGDSEEYHCMSMRLVQKFDKSEIEPTFVDLGLPSGTLWANMNVGAMSETDYGYYLAWGEKSVHYTSANPATGNFMWKPGFENGYANSTYCFYEGTGYTKYNTTDNIRLLQNEDDICFELYGSSCSVPSYSQWIELQNNCTKTWKVNGYEFVGPNGGKIFLPINGLIQETSITQYNNNGGYYWSKELMDVNNGYSWHFGGTVDFYYSQFSRSSGLGIRAVKPGPEKPHDAVYIGGKYWATMNIGATTVAGSPSTCYGDYFAWGEKAPYYSNMTLSSASAATFTWNTGTTSYNNSSYYGSSSYKEWDPAPYGTDNILKLEYDAARDSWGSNWRMPTSDDFIALLSACVGGDNTNHSNTTTLTSDAPTGGVYWLKADQNYIPEYKGVCGVLFVDRTDSSKRVFFPAAGFCGGATFSDGSTLGYYWSGSILNNKIEAYNMKLQNGGISMLSHFARYDGFTIRPVHD